MNDKVRNYGRRAIPGSKFGARDDIDLFDSMPTDNAQSVWPFGLVEPTFAPPEFSAGLVPHMPILGHAAGAAQGLASSSSDTLSGTGATEVVTKTSGSSMVIVATINGGGAPVGFATAVDDAIAYFEHTFTNSVTMNITFNWAPLSGGAVAQTNSYIVSATYSSVVAALMAQDGGIAADQGLVLPATDPFPAGTSANYALATPANTLWLTTAEATSLGLSTYNSDPANTNQDGTITLNSDDTFNFDPTLGGVAGEYDAAPLLEHEISEMMGRQFGGNNSADDGLLPEPLALLRYSSPGVVDTSDSYAGGYFSIDGGQTDQHSNMGEQFGDLADWGGVPTDDVVGYAQTGAAQYFTPIDVQVMEGLGWAPSQDDYWLGGVTDWTNGGDWTLGVPTAAANAVVQQGNPQVQASIAIQSLTLGDGATLTVGGGYLNVTGAATVANAVVNGANRLITGGMSNVSALTIGGTAEWQNSGTATQNGGNVTVGDNAGNVATLLNAPTGVYDIVDNGGIGIGTSTASSVNNQGTFEKTGGTGTSTISATFVDTGTVTATSGTLAFTGPSASFAGAITGTGGTVQLSTATTLKSGTTATVSNLTESGAGTIVTLIENLGYGGTFTDGASTNFNIASGDALTLSGTTSIAGTIGSAGTLDLTGGTTTLASGGGVFTSAWNVSGASTDLVVDENFTYTQTFSLTGGATVTDQSTVAGYFYITGAATISNATVNGFSRFITGAGGATIANFTVGGTVSFQNKGADTQSGGNVTVGDSAGDVATMLNTSTGTYDITDDSGIGRGGSTASLFTNQGLFEKTGGTGTSTVSVSFTNSATVTVTSGTLAFSGPGNSFNGALAGVGGTVAFTGGAASLKSGTTASVSNLSETGSGTLVTLLENLTYAGAFSEGAGSTFAIASGDTLTLDGSNTIAGTINNSGALDLSGGATAIDAGANLYVSTWALLGSGTTVTANAGVNYAGAFSEAAGDTFTLSGGYLLLNGTDTFSGGTVNGSRFLYTEGTTSVSGLTIGGTAEWENTKTVTENGGSVTIGDATSSAATLFNTSTGTYDITDNSGIGIGTSASSSITNQGLMEKTGGTTTSTISPAIANGGTLEVTSGTLDLRGAVTGTGTDTISGASTLEFDSQAALTQTIGFTGAGGTLYIESPATFSSSTTSSASISGFDTGGAGGDTIEVASPWTYVGFTENGGGTAGSLTFANGGNDISFTLLGDYTASLFHPNVTGGNTLLTYG